MRAGSSQGWGRRHQGERCLRADGPELRILVHGDAVLGRGRVARRRGTVWASAHYRPIPLAFLPHPWRASAAKIIRLTRPPIGIRHHLARGAVVPAAGGLRAAGCLVEAKPHSTSASRLGRRPSEFILLCRADAGERGAGATQRGAAPVRRLLVGDVVALAGGTGAPAGRAVGRRALGRRRRNSQQLAALPAMLALCAASSRTAQRKRSPTAASGRLALLNIYTNVSVGLRIYRR